MKPRVLLVSLREPDDPMVGHEVQCFVERASLHERELDVHSMASGRPDRGRLARYDAVFFGGSGAYSVLDDVPWIRDGLATLQDVLEARIPAWASCFGFQGLALALGGTVINDESLAEMGAVRLRLTAEGLADPVLSVLPAEFWAQEGHHDHVMELPAGVTLLAVGESVLHQAFKVDGAPFYASQFHPELTGQGAGHRLHHYRAHYQGDRDFDAILAGLFLGETPEVADLLPRLLATSRG